MIPIARTALLLTSLACSTAAAEAPSVTAAWIRATPPGVRTAAAYMTLESSGAANRLTGAATPAARAVEIHTHVVEGGLSRMARLTDLPLPAGQPVRLEPGGLHLMLIDIAAPLTPGTEVPLSLQFATGETVEIDVPVVDARELAPAH